MSQVPAGWLNDPYGRFQQRYWDGERWTEHVSTGGRQEVDPLGASTVIPIAIPGTATAGSADSALGIVGADTSPDGPEDDGSGADGSGGSGLTAFLDGLGPDPRERPACDEGQRSRDAQQRTVGGKHQDRVCRAAAPPRHESDPTELTSGP